VLVLPGLVCEPSSGGFRCVDMAGRRVLEAWRVRMSVGRVQKTLRLHGIVMVLSDFGRLAESMVYGLRAGRADSRMHGRIPTGYRYSQKNPKWWEVLLSTDVVVQMASRWLRTFTAQDELGLARVQCRAAAYPTAPTEAKIPFGTKDTEVLGSGLVCPLPYPSQRSVMSAGRMEKAIGGGDADGRRRRHS
jgi:hypothetical protein